MVESSDRADQAELVKELSALRVRGIAGIDVDTQAKPKLELPLLDSMASRYCYPDHSGSSRSKRIEILLRDSIALIEAEQFREDAYTLYMLDRASADLSPAQARAKVANRRGTDYADKRTRFHYEQQVRSLITARMIEVTSLKEQTTASVSLSQTPNFGESSYVCRNSYHDQFQSLIATGHRCVILQGEVGNGKSRLAWELATEAGSTDQVVWLSARSDQIGLQHGLPTKTTSPELIQQISSLMSASDRPAAIILDDLHDDGILDGVRFSAHSPLIIVTTRHKFNAILPSMAVMLVGPMTSSESLDLAQQTIQGIAAADAQLLVETVGCRPAAILLCAGLLIENPQLSVPELCSTIESHAAEVFDLVAVPSGSETLKAIYEEIYNRLAARDSLGAEMLECLAFTSGINIPLELLERYAAHAIELPTSLHEAAFHKSYNLLRRTHVVQEDEPGFLSMNPLTRSVLRGLLRTSAEQRCNQLLEIIHEWQVDLYAKMEVGHRGEIFYHIFSLFRQQYEIAKARSELAGKEEYVQAFTQFESKLPKIIGEVREFCRDILEDSVRTFVQKLREEGRDPREYEWLPAKYIDY